MITDFLLRVMLYTPFYILLGGFSVLHIKGLLSSLHGVATGAISLNPALNPLKPFLKSLWSVLAEAFGSKPETLTFQLTHILLVAVLFALLALVSALHGVRDATDRNTTAVQQLLAAQQQSQGKSGAKSAEHKKSD